MKTCPYCAENIQDAAIVCKHCGRELAPETVALVSQELAQEATAETASEPATGLVDSTPRTVPETTELKNKRPLWQDAIMLSGSLTGLFLIIEIAQVATGRMSWDEFLGTLGSPVFTGFIIATLISASGIWLWRAISTPLPEEILSVSDGDDDLGRLAPEQAAELMEDAADTSISEALSVEPSTEPTPAEPLGPKVYAIPDGLVSAPRATKEPIWKRAAKVGGAFAVLQSVVLFGVFAFGDGPEFIAALQPVQLILSIPLIFGFAFGITVLVILVRRYAESRSKGTFPPGSNR